MIRETTKKISLGVLGLVVGTSIATLTTSRSGKQSRDKIVETVKTLRRKK